MIFYGFNKITNLTNNMYISRVPLRFEILTGSLISMVEHHSNT